MAIHARQADGLDGLVHHSDRGVQPLVPLHRAPGRGRGVGSSIRGTRCPGRAFAWVWARGRSVGSCWARRMCWARTRSMSGRID
jgi:hypothetical protein